MRIQSETWWRSESGMKDEDQDKDIAISILAPLDQTRYNQLIKALADYEIARQILYRRHRRLARLGVNEPLTGIVEESLDMAVQTTSCGHLPTPEEGRSSPCSPSSPSSSCIGNSLLSLPVWPLIRSLPTTARTAVPSLLEAWNYR